MASNYGSAAIKKTYQNKFAGYNHNLYAEDGEIYDEWNMSSDHYPVMAPRRPRLYSSFTLSKPNGFDAHDGLIWADGTELFYNGSKIGDTSDSAKTFGWLGRYCVILPDKQYYNYDTGEFGSIEAGWENISASFQDGYYAGEEAESNTIYAPSVNWADRFKVGDAVTISGATDEGNNKTPIIREIDGHYLRFYEHIFTNRSGDTISVKRTMPDLDFICENENRLWGCKGDTIYSSKLGDIFNWNVFDGIASDSYAANVGSAGDFTACCSYLGYPVFFKEDHIYKVYGVVPSNFQVMGSATLGVESGSSRSLAVAGEILYYKSRIGIMAYSGGVPQSIAAAFGVDRYINASAGSDGVKYYVSMEGTDGGKALFVYDTRNGIWHKEDDLDALCWGYYDHNLYCLKRDGGFAVCSNWFGAPEGYVQEGDVESWVQFGDFVDGMIEKKGHEQIGYRCSVPEGGNLRWEIIDEDGNVQPLLDTVTKTSATPPCGKRSFTRKIIQRRDDNYKLQLYGVGDWRLWALSRDYYTGSDLQKH